MSKKRSFGSRAWLHTKALFGSSQARATLRDEDGWFFEWARGEVDTSGETVNHRTALGLTAYFSSGRNISDDIAKMPLMLMELTPKGMLQPILDHRMLRLVRDMPNPMMSPMVFWSTVISHMLFRKGGFAEIVHDSDGIPRELWPLNPEDVRVMFDLRLNELVYEVHDGQHNFVMLRSHEMIHLRGLGNDGLTSWAMAEVGRLAIGQALAAQKFGSSFFGNGATLKGVLEAPPELTPEALKLLQDTFRTRHAGAGNAYKTPVLMDGVTYKEIGSDPEKSQLIGIQHLGIENVIRLFRMPASKVQHDVRSAFANIYEQNQSYAKDALQGNSSRIVQELWVKLLLTKAQRATYIEEGVKGRQLRFRHDFAELLEVDPEKKANVRRKQFEMGMLTSNEARQEQGRKAFGPEGDRTYVAANLIPTDLVDNVFAKKDGAGADPPPPAEPEAEPEPPVDPEPNSDRMRELVYATEKLFKADFLQFVGKEHERAQHMPIQGGKFEKWANGFYPKHQKHVRNTLSTRYSLLLAVLHVEHSSSKLAEKMAERYIIDSRERLTDAKSNKSVDSQDQFAQTMAEIAVDLAQT